MAMVKTAGLDEAGRGPVIGPMVMAGVLVDEEQAQRLKNIGVKDSKLLSEPVRERMFDQIQDIVSDHVILVVSPEEIDAALASEELNLNWLEAIKSVEVINQLNPDRAIVDCPSNNIAAYTNYMKKKLSVECELVVEHKADMNHVESAAASILAKVTRDREVRKLRAQAGVDFGSGYPSDPKTIKFLKEHWNDFDFFRKSWASYKKVAEAKKQKTLGGY